MAFEGMGDWRDSDYTLRGDPDSFVRNCYR